MQLHQLRHFLAIVECGSFSRAAERLGKSQQALSRSMQALEEALGVRLLDRNPRAATPTAFGRLLLPYARNIDAEARGFRDALEAMRRAEPGRVRLGASPVAAARLVTEAVLRLTAVRPELRIAVLDGTQQTLSADLLAGELDLFVAVDNYEEVAPGLVSEVLAHDEYRIVAAANHPLAGECGVPAARLREFGWILGRRLGEIEQAWRAAFEQEGLPAPQPAVETTSMEFTRNALQSSRHLTVLPVQLIETEIERQSLRLIDAPGFRWVRPIVLHYRRNATLSAASLAVVDALHAAARR